MDAFFIGAQLRSRYDRFAPPVMPDTERVTGGHFLLQWVLHARRIVQTVSLVDRPLG